MRSVLFVGVILLFTVLVNYLVPTDLSLPHAQSIFLLGTTLLVSYLVGRSINRFQLPKISGYLITGLIIGPELVNILTGPAVSDLQLLDNLALGLIAITAGGEFRLARVRQQWRLLLQVSFWQVVIVITGIGLVILAVTPLVPFLKSMSLQKRLGVGLLFGVLAVAKSPATTIAIITETRSKGPFTDFILGITILKDILIVLLFALVLALARPLIDPQAHFSGAFIMSVSGEILISLLAGALVGGLIILYLKFVETDFFLFLFSVILLVVELASKFHLEIILVLMMAGFVVQNLSAYGHKLIDTIEQSSLPVYVIFFTIAGASLKISIFLANWLFTIILVAFRMLTTHLGTWVGAHFGDGSSHIKRYGWMGFIGQAGLTLGLSVILEKDLPPPLGTNIKTIIVAAIAINQIVGPILFRYALAKSGEIPHRSS